MAKKKEEDPYLPRLQWAMMAEDHWREFRPKMYAEMKEKGILNKMLYLAEQNAINLAYELELSGVDPLTAEEIALREYILLPSEEGQPRLGESPNTY